jgi:lycopene beta-cyclase
MIASTRSEAGPFVEAGAPGRPRLDRNQTTYDHLILGAGCAGLSLAWHLRERGDPGSIALVDRRSGYRNDRTWCYWDVEPTPFDHLATHCWDRWAVVDDRGRRAECRSGRYRYRRIRSIDFYRCALDRLSSEPGVDFYLGEAIRGRVEEGGGVRAEASGGPIRGRRAFESAGRPSELAEGAPRGQVAMVQHFLGQRVRVDRPSFDPGCPILMDFRVDQRDGPHFAYVLPLSSTEALIENTYLFPCAVSASRHRSEISAYLDRCFGLRRFEAVEEEAGRIPMTTHRPGVDRGSKVVPIGLIGGSARPSSGYAFARIQRQCRGLAVGDAPASRPAARKYDFFDAVFLRALADRPAEAPRLFRRMFEGVDPDALVRFLADRSSLLDEARLIAALPKWPFVTAAARSAETWARRWPGS